MLRVREALYYLMQCIRPQKLYSGPLDLVVLLSLLEKKTLAVFDRIQERLTIVHGCYDT